MKLPLTQSCRPKRENRSTHLAPLLGEREPQRQSIYGRETLARGDGKCKFARSRQWAKQLAKRLFIFLFHCLKIVAGKSLPPGSVIVTIYNGSNGCRFSKKAYVAVRYRVRNATFLEKEKKIKELIQRIGSTRKRASRFWNRFASECEFFERKEIIAEFGCYSCGDQLSPFCVSSHIRFRIRSLVILLVALSVANCMPAGRTILGGIIVLRETIRIDLPDY